MKRGPPFGVFTHGFSSRQNQVKSRQVKASIWLSQVKASNCMRLDLTLSLVRNPDLAKVRNPVLGMSRKGCIPKKRCLTRC